MARASPGMAGRSGALRDSAAENLRNAGEVMGGQPQPQEMTAAIGIVVALVGLPGVQDFGIGDQLNVAGLEFHLEEELRVVGDRLDDVQCFELLASRSEE